MSVLKWLLGGASALHLLGCGNCNAASIVPVIITITDASSGNVICDATVEAIGIYDYSVKHTLSPQAADGGGCVYRDSEDDYFTLTVTAQGYQPLTVQGGGGGNTCPPSLPPVEMKVALSPN